MFVSECVAKGMHIVGCGQQVKSTAALPPCTLIHTLCCTLPLCRAVSCHVMSCHVLCCVMCCVLSSPISIGRLLWYKEPTPEPVGDMDAHLVGKVEVRGLVVALAEEEGVLCEQIQSHEKSEVGYWTTCSVVHDIGVCLWGALQGVESLPSPTLPPTSHVIHNTHKHKHTLSLLQVHKLIFMAPQPVIVAVRPDIEAQLSSVASVTTALSGMLEVRCCSC